MKSFKNVLDISGYFIGKIEEDDICLDMTLGKGNDFIKILDRLETGHAYGFDIQDLAIEKTRLRLEDYDPASYSLIKDSHHKILDYVHDQVDFAIYNLGYLPSGDKTIITRPDTTIESLKSLLSILSPKGLIVLSFYLGHEGGFEEYEKTLAYLEDLDQKKYSVLNFRYINQINNPPQVVVIERLE